MGAVMAVLALAFAGCATVTPPAGPTPTPPPSSRNGLANAIVVDAISLIGAPYRWGGESPGGGFDCSGLVQYVLGQAGIPVPRTSYAQAAALPVASREDMAPGDLVFFNTMGQPFSHVGIYIGHRQFVSALNPRQGVAVQSLDTPYWTARLDGVRRLPQGQVLAEAGEGGGP